jgi:RNA recognition motif-containing protein
MSTLDLMVLKYLRSQGYHTAARVFRRDAATGTEDVETDHQLNAMYQDYLDSPEAADALYETMTANAPKDVNLDSLLGGGLSGVRTDGTGSLTGPKPPPDSSECNRVFLGGLSFKISEESLQDALQDCGKIEEVQWITDAETGNFYGTAFATFETLEAAKKAVAANGRSILGRMTKINFAPPKVRSAAVEKRAMPPAPKAADMPPSCRILFLGNLGFTVTDEDVRAFFEPCGEIHEVRFQKRENGEFKGCGFIEFVSEYSILKAIKLHAKPLKGRPVRLDYA